MNDPYDEGDEEIPAISVKRKKKKPKTAEDWASFSGWDIYLYGGLDTEETAFYSSIEPELAAELLQSELDSMKEKRKRRGRKGRRSEMRRRDGRSNAPVTPQEEKLLGKQLLTKVRSFIVTSEEAQHREGLLLPLGYPLIAQIAQVAGAIHVRVRAITTIRTNKPMFAALA